MNPRPALPLFAGVINEIVNKVDTLNGAAEISSEPYAHRPFAAAEVKNSPPLIYTAVFAKGALRGIGCGGVFCLRSERQYDGQP